jgi:protein phosphatase
MARFATRTDPGRMHAENEDAIGVDAAHGLWLVADGMGGHASGEVASAIVRDTMLRLTQISLADAVGAAHHAVVDAAAKDSHCRGMGSTIVAIALHGGAARTVWVGDSRAYLWRARKLQRISRDHSVDEMLRVAGQHSEAEIRAHPQRKLLTQTLGHGDPVASSASIDLRAGDWLILCSDGLHDELDDAEIAALLGTMPSPDDAVVQLVDAANAKGGRDNISVVVVAISDDDLPSRWGRLRRFANKAPWLPALAGVAVALLVVSLILLFLRGM